MNLLSLIQVLIMIIPLNLGGETEVSLVKTDDFDGYRFIQFNATNYDLTSALTGVYDNIVKEYVEDIYRDTIELYVISTVKVGYFTVLPIINIHQFQRTNK